MEAQIRTLETFADSRGSLTVAQEEVPFEIRRVFWVYNMLEGELRGGHAHRRCEQMLVAVLGSFAVLVEDTLFRLDSPDKALVIPPGNRIDYSPGLPGSIMLVLASEEYDPDDYIDQT